MHQRWIERICLMMKIPPKIFGISLEGLSVKQLFARLDQSTKPTWIVTANAEILLEAHRDRSYADVLKQADVRMIDGSGPAFLLRLFGNDVSRIAGVDLAEALMEWAHRRNLRVGMIGGLGEKTAERAGEVMKKKYPELNIETEHGGMVDRLGNDDSAGEEARHRLVMFSPHVLLVAFGHPKQERWILKHLNDFPELKVIVGLGGTFDYWAGTAVRAPKIFQTIGLEWLWRLITEPKRIKRILNAVIVFPYWFLIDRFA